MKTIEGYFYCSYNIDKKSNSDKKYLITLFSTENLFERTGGLLKFPPLNLNQGLLINKCNSIHTFGMKYSLDVVYLSRHLKVVKLVENIKPTRMSLCFGAEHTLEMIAGEINRLGIKEGMTLITAKELSSH
ncbi:MAG: uncharacterized membrane protein (UPF0127 family) [Cellvibrionaceae bacterium]